MDHAMLMSDNHKPAPFKREKKVSAYGSLDRVVTGDDRYPRHDAVQRQKNSRGQVRLVPGVIHLKMESGFICGKKSVYRFIYRVGQPLTDRLRQDGANVNEILKKPMIGTTQ